jgi:hypothetical protein
MNGVPGPPGSEPGQVERWVGDVCRSLGVPVEDPADDLFAAGGTSLTAIRLMAQAEAEYGEDCLPPDDIYESSTIRGIAASILRNSTALVPSEVSRSNGQD